MMGKKLIDYIDFERINLLLEGFNNATGFVTAILDLEGNILSKSGWRTICTDFHRVHPETSARCTESDTCLAGQLESGQKYNCYKCLNGLIDVAVPIIINDEHVANLFSGQFFFEKPDHNFFNKQAERFNFNKKDYLEALDKVPVLSEEKVKKAMYFLLDMTLLISEMTQQRIEQTELNNSLKESEEKYKQLYESNQMPISIFETKTLKFLSVNNAFIEKYGYTEEEFLKMTILDVRPDTETQKVIQSVSTMDNGLTNAGIFLHKKKNGEIIHVEILRYDLVFEGKNAKLVFANDITERKQTEEDLKRSEHVLNETQRISKIGGWEYDVESGETYFSDEIFNIYGISDNKMFKSEEGIAFYHSDDRPLVSDSFKKVITQGIPYDIEVRFINALGKNMWVRTVGKPVYKNEKIVKILGSLMDITVRKMAEEKIQTQIAELKRYNATMVDREIKMIQLKKEINDYCRQLNLPEKYSIPT